MTAVWAGLGTAAMFAAFPAALAVWALATRKAR